MAKQEKIPLIIATIIIIGILTHIYLQPVQAQSISNMEIYSLNFSDTTETLKHLDNETECYNASGSAGEYVDSTNGYFVFTGDNTDTSNGYDEPIAVVKGYNETNGYSSYAVLPYNYTVMADFSIPSSPGYGNFYILPRYENVNNKYEVAVNTQSSELVFNYVLNGDWHELKNASFSSIFTIQTGSWYRLIVNVTWEYNSTKNMYMNHLVAKIVDLSDTSKYFTADVWDANLTPNEYYGLAFLGFDDSHAFTVYMDNVIVYTDMEETFLEPSETISPDDLNITSMYCANDTNMLYIYLKVDSAIRSNSSYTKYWATELDLDKDSRNSDSGFDYEYNIIANLNSDGSAQANLYFANGTWIKGQHILGGGIGYNYLVIEVNKTLLSGLSNSLYLYSYTQLGGTGVDYAPSDDSTAGDYAIYYLVKPVPDSSWTSISDPAGDASPDYLDIIELSSAYNSEFMFFNLTVSGLYPWSGGSNSVYQIFVDADNNANTGYEVGGIGADYLIEYQSGYVPRLYNYTGTGTSWSWNFLKREEYSYNPGGEHSVVILAYKSDFNETPLSSSITIYGQTVSGSSLVDSTSSSPVPVPENGLLIALVSLVVMLVLLARRRL